MEIQRRMTITDVDGVSVLKDEGDAIIFVLSGQEFTPEQIRQIRDALTAVLDEEVRGPWQRIEDVPLYVKRVLDREGVYWTRRDTDEPGHFDGEPFSYANGSAPFTLATFQ